MKLYIYILTTIGLLFSGSLKAQFPTNIPQQGGNGFPTTGFPNGDNQTGFPQRNPTDKKSNANGRIGLDDSTKVIYGPTSTKYFLEEDVFNNRKRLYNIDTTMDGVHNYNFVQRNKNLYQDLGNIGTAIRPIFYKAPEQIGTLLGYDAFSLYTFKPSQVRYYNTKSPFSNIIYVPGGNDQDLLQFELSRNIDSLWNVGINVQRITANKQLIDKTVSGDNTAISHWDFMMHTNYQTKNKKYSILAYFNLSDHTSNDQGGVVRENNQNVTSQIPITYTYDEMLAFTGNKPILTNALSNDKSYNIHVYHEYVGYKAFQIYQIVDYQSRKVDFKDKDFRAGWQNGFYPFAYLPNGGDGFSYPKDTAKIRKLGIANKLALDSLYNESQYSNIEHKTGIKGFYKGFNYRLHLRQRYISYVNPLNIVQKFTDDPLYLGRFEYEPLTIKRFENFIGIWLNQYFKDSTRTYTEGELQLPFKDWRVKFEYQGKWLNVGFSSISSSPTFAHQYTINNGFRWRNNFQFPVDSVGIRKNMNVQNIFGYTTLKYKNLVFRPSIDLSLITDYIYYDKNGRVKNDIGDIFVTKIGMALDYKIKKLGLSSQLFITPNKLDSTLTNIRIPTIFFNSRITYDLLYRKKLYVQAGVELHYKSGYYADAYMPAIQQFHLQDTQKVEGYLQADAFANLRINRVRLFFKFGHVNQGLWGDGYYVSPKFAAMGRTFEFGLHWLLFD